jgi:HPt (histidine-containing phosphotransfer) domain-containing protein
MSTTDEPAFDWSQAASLLGDDPNSVEPDMAAIVRELVEQAVGQFKDLRSLNAETDRKTVSSQAHALRGCLLNFGFTEVGGILFKVEKGPEYSQAEYQTMLDQAEAAFAASKKMLAERYPSVGIS